jgi:dihydropteroate synthase
MLKPIASKRQTLWLKTRDFSLSLGETTKIMGIVNVTPDSFSGDGLFKKKNFTAAALRLALKQIKDGADFIDVGGESSRPGAQKISVEEEIKRVLPVIKKLAKVSKIPICVDTYKGKTALHALDAGASMINNIQGLRAEKKLLQMAARYNAGIVIMHMRGTPKTMQTKTHYKNLIDEMIGELKIAVENCLEIGIKSDNIIVDPGIGFSKTPEQNLEILNRLQEFKIFKRPVLIGTSRKSFIGKISGQPPNKRLSGTIASSVLAIANGAHILRVHDVAPLKEAASVADAILTERILTHT